MTTTLVATINGGTGTSSGGAAMYYKVDYDQKTMCINFYDVINYATVPSSLTVTIPAGVLPYGISNATGGNTTTSVAFNGMISSNTFVFLPITGAFSSASGQFVAGSSCMQIQ
jgi:hypothetical protein